MRNLFKLLALLVLCIPLNAQLLDGTRVYSDTSDGAEFCIEELYTNGSSGVCLKAPDSLASELVFTLPSAYPGGTYCLQMSASGVISTTGAACGGAGSSLPVTDTTSIAEGSGDPTKEVRFEVDGITTGTVRVLTVPDSNLTIAGINIAQSFSATQTFNATADFNSTVTLDGTTTASGVVNFDNTTDFDATMTIDNLTWESDSTFDMGAWNVRVDEFWGDNIHADTLFFTAEGSSSHTYFMDLFSGQLQVSDSASNPIWYWDTSTTPDSVVSYADIRPQADSTYDLGSSTRQWQTIHGDIGYFDGIDVTVSITPVTNGVGDVGQNGDAFDEMWVDDRYCINNAGISGTACLNSVSVGGTEVLQLAAAAVSSSGSFYQRTFSAGDVSCSGVTDGWFGVRTDTEELQFCEGSATKVVPSVGNSFSPVTVNCASGEVITDPRYENGILVEGSCGAN